MSAAPTFILSTERSGSTLLRCLLDTHPEVAAPGELLLGDLCSRLHLIVERTLGQLPGALPTNSGEDAVDAEVRRLAGGILDRYCAARGRRMWCEKTPANLRHAELLARIFPEARFVCLYRQGLDVARSCLEVSRYGFMKELAPFVALAPENLPLALVRSWIVKTGQLLAFERQHLERCFRLRYETLVAEPRAALEPLQRFLGLEVHAGLADLVFALPHTRGGGDPGFWSTDRILRDRVGNGRRELLPHLPAEVLPKLNEMLTELGYEPVEPTSGAPSRH